MHTLTWNSPNLVIKLNQSRTTERGPKQEPWIKETNRGTYISADSCTSSAAEKKASFRHRSKLLATNIFNNKTKPRTRRSEKDRNFNPSKLEGWKETQTHAKLCLVKNKSCWVGGSFSLFPFLCYGDTEQGKKREKEAFKDTVRERRLSDPSLFYPPRFVFPGSTSFSFFGWLWSGVATSTMLYAFSLKISRHVWEFHTWQVGVERGGFLLVCVLGVFYGSP